ncbi:MAG: hypothetical protein ACE37F_21440 [Nannocystaceae bacterium]|nr:hypothetical protein [bacterium]
MAPRKTSDGRDIPRLLGARQRTMSLLAAVFEDEARREASRRGRRRSKQRSRVGFALAAALGCVLAALAGGVGAWSLQTPHLDALDEALALGDLEVLDDALAQVESDTPRARAGRALARAQQAVWGAAAPAEASMASRGAEGPHHDQAAALVDAMRGDATTAGAWASAITAGRTLQDLPAAVQALSRAHRPAGASRTLAALQFSLGDVSAALQTLDATGTAGARADAAFYESLTRPGGGTAVGAPGRAALLRAKAEVESGEREAARVALAQARASMLPWDPVATTTGLRLSFLAADADGLRAWSADARFSPQVRALAAAYAQASAGAWDDTVSSLASHDSGAPWVAYVLGYAAAERGRWTDALRLAATARRGMPGRVEPEVLGAWVAGHVLDPEGAHRRLVALSERAPWAPRLWTARAESASASGRPAAEVTAAYERALEVEHRPASAAAALARTASPDEALHLWAMAATLDPTEARHRLALGEVQADLGRLGEAWANLATAQDAARDPEAWLTLVELALVRSRGQATPEIPVEIGAWLDAALASGASAEDVQRLRLRTRLARGERVGAQASALALRHRDDAAIVALAVEALGAEGRLPAARHHVERARRTLARGELPVVTLALANVLRERGEVREAAQLSFKGWSALRSDAHALTVLAAASDAVDAWLALGNTNGARAIARELTQRLPSSPEAWLLRARVQRAADEPDFACRSLGRARTLDPNVVLERGWCRDEAM